MDPEPPSKEELLARYAELQRKTVELQERMREASRVPTSTLVMRWLMILAGAIVLFGGGWWLAGGWGIAGAAALPVVAFFGYALLGPVVAGATQPLGELFIAVDEGARVVRFRSTLEEARLPAALLAQLDRWVFRHELGPSPNPRQKQLLAAVRAKLTEPEPEPEPEPEKDWRAEPGEAKESLVKLGRNRLGLTYTFSGSIGGPAPAGDQAEVCLALLGYGLKRPDGQRLAGALRQYCDEVERKGRSGGPSMIRKSGKLLL
jgi:hypothetical protein